MRVLLISQFYAPEVTAARVRVQAFAEGLAERGHDVEVVCEVPNHPSGVTAQGYRPRGERRRLNGVDVRYVWVRARPERTTRNRLLHYATFAAAATAGGMRARRPDVVWASSPPLPVGAAARAVALRHRVPWVFDVRDLWPEAAVALGELRGERAIAAAERLERSLYGSAARIVTVTEPFREAIARTLEDMGEASEGRIAVIPNGTTRLWVDAGAAEPDRAAAGLPDGEFVLGYGGNVGIAQGLEAAVEAAGSLGDGFRLLVVGQGPRLGALRELASRLPEGRVEFRDLMEPARAAATLRACDALLVPLADSPELTKFVPSKLFDYTALGRPVIVAAAGEPQRLAAEAGAGLAVPPGDPGALADAVRRLRDEPELAGELSERGRDFARSHLRDAGIERLERVLGEVVQSS
jgi:glycosyltransferase involved in cell wall biosynthesis